MPIPNFDNEIIKFVQPLLLKTNTVNLMVRVHKFVPNKLSTDVFYQ